MRKSALFALAFALVGMNADVLGQVKPKPGEWWTYGGDLASTRYSPLDQINKDNFKTLEVAWRFKTDFLGPRPEFNLQGTPLMIDGILYATAGTRRAVVALDAATGELLWMHSENEGKRGESAPRQLSGRGLAYWTDGAGGKDSRIVYVTPGYRMVALDTKTGVPVKGFGENGVVDLKMDDDQKVDPVTGEIGLHATPIIAKDVIVVGAAHLPGGSPKSRIHEKGFIRGYDARTGKRLWIFHTIPQAGEFGNDSWEKDSWAYTGNAGVWAQMTVDEETNTVFLPVELPTGDYYGGHRPGNGLFGESLVALDLKTGQRKWHFQLVHHGIWDMDIPCAPMLMDLTVDGRAIKAVGQPTKQGWIYVFDRITGKPVWPIEERPVPQSDVAGEKTSPTQPHPTRPPAYARNYVKIPDDLIDFTPDLRARALESLKRYKTAPSPFTPGILGDVKGMLGALGGGTATNWPGGGFDPETHIAYAPAANLGFSVRSLAEPPPGVSDLRYLTGVAGRPFVEVWGPGDCCSADSGFKTREDLPLLPPGYSPPEGTPLPQPGGEGGGGLNVQGLPIVKPPYGILAAIDLDRGELRQHPQQSGVERPEHSEDRPAGDVGCRLDGDEDARRDGRSAGHDHAGASARRDVARVRQTHRQGGGHRLHARSAERIADDVHGGRQAIHRRCGQYHCRPRELLWRVPGIHAAELVRQLAMGSSGFCPAGSF